MSWFSRRRKFLLFLVLIFVFAVFIYVRKEIFFQQAQKIIEQNLTKDFPGQFTIGKMTPSMFYGLVLENFCLKFPQTYGLGLEIKVDKAYVDYKLNKKNLKLASVDFTFFLVDGQIALADKQPLIRNLQGKLFLTGGKLTFKDINATFGQGHSHNLKINGELSEDKLCLKANLECLKISNFDILTNINLTLNKAVDLQDNTPKLVGRLETYGSVINKTQAVPELSSSFELRDSKLHILTFRLGDNYDLRGLVELEAPYHTDLALNFYQAAPSELLAQLNPSDEPNFSGLINGLIKISGELKQPEVEGYLEVKDGHIGQLDFLNADINIRGRYPKISIVDSRIFREEDSFIMEGEIDLANLNNQDFIELRFMADKGMLWQGWDITRKRDNQVHMSKNVASDVKVTFDTFIDNESARLPDDDKNELGLEYRILGDKLLKLRLRKEEEILGVERRVKF